MTRGFYKMNNFDKQILTQIAFLEIQLKARLKVLKTKETTDPKWAVERARVGGFVTRIRQFKSDYQYWFT